MTELVRDTAFGHFLRFVTKQKLLPYEEDVDPSLWKRYAHKEKSANMAHHGHPGPEEEAKDEDEEGKDEEKDDKENGDESSENDAAQQTEANTRANEGRDDSSESRGQGEGYNDHSGQKIDPEKGRDVTIVDWFGDNDQENPQNWSTGKKVFVSGMICFLTLSVYIGSAIYSAGEMGVEEQFHVSEVVATLGLTCFVGGYGLGPMIWSPLSEIPAIGRNPVYIGTLVVFVFFQFGVIYAKNIGMLLAFRFLTGFFGSPVLATGGASMGDMWSPQKRAYAIAVWGAAAVCGPTAGPLVGGFAAQHKGWTWTIWELTWLSGLALIILTVFLPETSGPNILYRRSRRLRKLTGRNDLKCEGELEQEQMSGKDVAMMCLAKPFILTFTEPILFCLNLYIALIYGLLYCWFESFPIVFEEIYMFNLGEEGLSYVGILIGAFVVIPPFFLYLKYVQEPQFDEEGNIQPEKRLPPALIGGFFIPICMFWFGWTSRASVQWICPIIASSFFTIGTFLLFNSVLNYIGDAYPKDAASALAGNDFMRSAFGAGFPVFASAMYKNLGVAWASSLLGFLSIVFIPIPFVLYFFGEKIRKSSKKARHDI